MPRRNEIVELGLPVSVSEQPLPERLGRFIGRDASIRALVESLCKHRFVSIIGPGGMGKGAVAISMADTMLDAFGAPCTTSTSSRSEAPRSFSAR